VVSQPSESFVENRLTCSVDMQAQGIVERKRKSFSQLHLAPNNIKKHGQDIMKYDHVEVTVLDQLVDFPESASIFPCHSPSSLR
jgi:hypothetical protein